MKRQDKFNAFIDMMRQYAAERWQAYRDSDDRAARIAEYKMQILVESNMLFVDLANRHGLTIEIQ